MKKKLLLLVVILLVAIGSLGYYYVSYLPFKNKPYNLLMISVDTLRSDHVGVYGYSKNTTPNIDAWAKKDGVIFTKAYTQIPMTYPSFASTMTGLSPYQTSIYNNGRVRENEDGSLYVEHNAGNRPIDDSSKTLAEILKKENYTTGAFVINSNLRASTSHLNRGFDTYNVAGENYLQKDFQVRDLVDDGISWLDANKNSSKPFFLWMHFLDPHDPFTPTVKNACRFADTFCNEIREHGVTYYSDQLKSLQGCQTTPLLYKTVGPQLALYDAELYQTDSFIGKILAYVKKNHLDDNTIIIFYADHGEGFDHNYYFTHSEVLYESGVKIPYIISTPQTRGKSRTVTNLIDNTKTLATVVSLLGFPKDIPKGLSGVADLVTNPKATTQTSDTMFYINQSKTKFAIRKGDMKYIMTNAKQGSNCLSAQTEELYNIASDPSEEVNLIKDEPQVASGLRAELIDHINQSKVSFKDVNPINNATPSGKTNQHEQDVLKTIRDMGY